MDLLDNFLNIHKISMMESGWGKEGKIEVEPANADLGARWRGGVGAEAKSLANGHLIKLYFIHPTSQCTVEPDIYIDGV